MSRATARHILVSDEQECNDLKKQITDGSDFAELARSILPVRRANRAATSENSAPAKWCPSLTRSCSVPTLARFRVRCRRSLDGTCWK